MASGLCRAQYSNHQLYQAYLEQDMNVWEQYIASSNWDSLNTEEKKQLLNYEYGYAAYVTSYEPTKAEEVIGRYEYHLRSSVEILPKAEYLAHMAALSTYKLSVEKKLKYATALYDFIRQAMNEGKDHPFVNEMMGNIEYYSPFGSKKKALQYYQLADSLYTAKGEEYHMWNQQAVRNYIGEN